MFYRIQASTYTLGRESSNAVQLSVVCENCSSILTGEFQEFSSMTNIRAWWHYTWTPHFAFLANGINRIEIIANAKKQSGYLVKIDDLSICLCHDFKRECLLSAGGWEYMDNISMSADGKACTEWSTERGTERGIEWHTTDEQANYTLHTLNKMYDILAFNTTFCRGIDLYQGGSIAHCSSDSSHFHIPYCACATDWHRCPATGMCLPQRLSFDKYNYRIMFTGDKFTLSVNISRPDKDPRLYDKQTLLPSNMNVVWQKLVKYSDMTMTLFVNKVSHTLNDTIVKCRWQNNKDCSHQFIERYTDMGLCYTFNMNKTSAVHSNTIGETD